MSSYQMIKCNECKKSCMGDKYDGMCHRCCKEKDSTLYYKVNRKMNIQMILMQKLDRGIGYYIDEKCEECNDFYPNAKKVCSKCYLNKYGLDEYVSIFGRREEAKVDMERDYVKDNVLEVLEEFKSENRFHSDAQVFTDKQFDLLLKSLFNEDTRVTHNELYKVLIGQGDMFSFVLMLTAKQAEKILKIDKTTSHYIAPFVIDPMNVYGGNAGGTYECYYQTEFQIWPTKAQIKKRWKCILPQWIVKDVDLGACPVCTERMNTKDKTVNSVIATYCEDGCKVLSHLRCIKIVCLKCTKSNLLLSGVTVPLRTMKLEDFLQPGIDAFNAKKAESSSLPGSPTISPGSPTISPGRLHPQNPTRSGSTQGRVFRYLTPSI